MLPAALSYEPARKDKDGQDFEVCANFCWKAYTMTMAPLRFVASFRLVLVGLVFLAAVPSAARADPPDRMTISLPSVLTCTREKDHLVCIVPLPAAREPAPREPPAPKPAPQLKAKKWSDDRCSGRSASPPAAERQSVMRTPLLRWRGGSP